ncbi:MAG: HAD family hydrolase [Candidatus Hodarchaeota archaeon]
MIEAITFDLWNTIFENKSYSKFRVDFIMKFLEAKNYDYTFETIKLAFDNSFKFLDYQENGFDFHHRYTEGRISKIFDTLKTEITDPEIRAIKENMEKAMLKDPPSLKKGVKRTLEILSKNYNIGLISNTGITPGHIIIDVFQKYDILKYFQVTIFSDEIGYYKPHSLLFESALKNLQCKPNYAAHVGDLLLTDVKGAKDYGMRAIWFNDTNQSKLPDIQPDYEVKEMLEVVDIIKNF